MLSTKTCSCCHSPLDWQLMPSLGTQSYEGEVLELANCLYCSSTQARILVPHPTDVLCRLGGNEEQRT